jgi:acetylornithine deacetylase/succinyl-diaminopimelate desuccinylase-like protein
MDVLKEDLALAQSILVSPAFQEVQRYLAETDEVTLGHQIELTEISAPPFGEESRARRMSELLAECGAVDVAGDAEGNVVAWCPGPPSGSSAPIVVAAHLDTVFPSGTDVSVTRDGDLLKAPGISDDGRGLAALLALCRALTCTGTTLHRPLMLVATVGEEGLGDLRGVHHLFSPDGAARGAAAFISLDGAGRRGIVHQGLGARRFRVDFEGPGGHSWSDWGRVNPIHGLSSGLASLQDVSLPEGTTLSVGRVGGGTSINAIPQSAWAEIEVRSLHDAELERVEREILSRLESAIDRENQGRAPDSEMLTTQRTTIGSRPAGETPVDSPLVRAAVAATSVLGGEAAAVPSSTDANVPMAAGIPAITIGAGGKAGEAHTTDEWYRNTNGPDGIARAALILMLLEVFGA